ncbi:MAG: adenylate cyclase [Actinomycetota bacterium]|jgi:CYTH domain-containing protein|nr:adenylate cyclase [Actinomycetota bacterium]
MPRGIEIERKFLVDDRSVLDGKQGTGIVQGYLASSSTRSVRVRRDADLGVLTVKGPRRGASRFEAECEIPVEIADQLLEECQHPLVKTRYPVMEGGRLWAIDEFHDTNEGLVLAEVELDSEDEALEVPHWCGEEVTNDERYYNERLARCPFAAWRRRRGFRRWLPFLR